MSEPIKIEVLYFDGCPNFDSAREMAVNAAKQAGADAHIAMIKIESNDEAQAKQFVGSPSIRVAGEDIDPIEDKNQQYGMRCRVYFTDEGMGGLPSRAKMLKAIEQALGKQNHKSRVY